MKISKIRSVLVSLVGQRYRELPDFDLGLRTAIEDTLAELDAKKCGESGTPAFEVNNEYFRIGRRKLKICTEDEMFVSLWGPKSLVDDIYARIMKKLEARKIAV
jgi:hypothetical protein